MARGLCCRSYWTSDASGCKDNTPIKMVVLIQLIDSFTATVRPFAKTHTYCTGGNCTHTVNRTMRCQWEGVIFYATIGPNGHHFSPRGHEVHPRSVVHSLQKKTWLNCYATIVYRHSSYFSRTSTIRGQFQHRKTVEISQRDIRQETQRFEMKETYERTNEQLSPGRNQWPFQCGESVRLVHGASQTNFW